jgi:signal transduction histidine kinase/serine phosphatase RsbU (regulator of sigma subunit)
MTKLRAYLIFVTLFALFSCKSETFDSAPSIHKGYLDLKNYDFSQKVALSLEGEWEFYPNQWIKAGEFPVNAAQFQTVPKIWNGNLPGKKSADGFGYGTLRLRIDGLSSKYPLMVYISSLATAHAFYCGAELLSYSGEISETAPLSIPSLAPSLGSLPVNCSQSQEFILYISNWNEFKGGPWTAPLLGTKKQVLGEFAKTFALDFFFMGVTAIMFIYHFVLWLVRKKDKKSLIFSSICFLFAMRILGTGKELEFFFPEAGLYEMMNKFEYIGFYGIAIMFPIFCQALFPRDFYQKIIGLNAIIFAILLLEVLFRPAFSYTSHLFYGQLLSLAIIAYVLYGTFRILYLNRPGAKIMAIGFFVVIVTIIHDLIISHDLIQGVRIAPMGFFGFLVSQSAILARLFADAYNTAEHLTENLQSEVAMKTHALLIEDEQKTAFFQNISHELRTPLTLIIGPVELAFKESKTLSREQSVLVLSNAKRLLKLVNQLLDLQKITAKKMEIYVRPVSVVPLLRVSLFAFGSMAQAKQIRLDLDILTNDTNVNIDPFQVEKCIINYLSNSFKFTPDSGQIKIIVSDDENKNFVRVTVKDSGRGVPEGKQSLLFRKFGYSEVSLTRDQEGTGLGLSLVKELVELHGGRVGFRSGANQGSEFWFTLPKTSDDIQNFDVKSSYVDPTNLSVSQRFPVSEVDQNKFDHKVLIVEDNEDLRSFMKMCLLHTKVDVFEAFDGEDGWEKAKLLKPDLILTDLMMPRLSGDNLIRRIKEEPSLKSIPVVLLTAKVDSVTRREVREAGADGYLAKPFNADELILIIKNFLSLKLKEKYFLKEVAKAKKIQASLLPNKKIEIPNIRYASFYQSQDEIGGDFFDIMKLDDDRYRFIIADVSGHGLPAALFASMIKILFRKSKSENIAKFMESANQDLIGNLAGNFITLLGVDIDVKHKKLAMANAGHPPLLRIRNGQIELLESKGVALGLKPNATYEIREEELLDGDRLVLSTDGIVELKDAQGMMMGEENFLNILLETKGKELEEAVKAIVDHMYSYCGETSFEDDATLLMLDYR